MPLNAQCILVTGGCGFVGSWLVTEILEGRTATAAQIVVLDNLFNGRRKFLPNSPRITLHKVDLTDAHAVSRIVMPHALTLCFTWPLCTTFHTVMPIQDKLCRSTSLALNTC